MPKNTSQSRISFKQTTPTNIEIIQDGKTVIGQIWSYDDKQNMYPYSETNGYTEKNAIQICGFNNISQTWKCYVFENTKDVVVDFNPPKPDHTENENQTPLHIPCFIQLPISEKEPIFHKIIQHCGDLFNLIDIERCAMQYHGVMCKKMYTEIVKRKYNVHDLSEQLFGYSYQYLIDTAWNHLYNIHDQLRQILPCSNGEKAIKLTYFTDK